MHACVQVAGDWLQTPSFAQVIRRSWPTAKRMTNLQKASIHPKVSGTIKHSTKVNISSRHSSINILGKGTILRSDTVVICVFTECAWILLGTFHFFYAVGCSIGTVLFRDLHTPALPIKDTEAKLSSQWTTSSPNKKAKNIPYTVSVSILLCQDFTPFLKTYVEWFPGVMGTLIFPVRRLLNML